MTLTFDEARHQYRLNGVVLPGVTSILGMIREPSLERWRGKVGNEAADKIARESANFGTRVHSACELIAKGQNDTLGTFDFDADVLPFAEAFASWFNANVREVLGSETRIASAEHGYAGSLDLCAVLMDGSSAIVDIKTSKGNYPHPKWGAQLAAYQVALLESVGIVTTKRLIIQMPSDKPGELIVHERPLTEARTDWNAFLAALTLHRWVQASEGKPVIGTLARPAPRQQGERA